MSLSAESLHRLAAESGFRIEFLEKIDRLLDLLQAMFRDPYLSGRLVLKGGTALNLIDSAGGLAIIFRHQSIWRSTGVLANWYRNLNKSQKQFVWAVSTALIFVFWIGVATTIILTYLELGEHGN